MSYKKGWTGPQCWVLLDGVPVAELAEWRFNVERPYVPDEELGSAVTSALAAATGLLVMDGGGRSGFLDCVRQGRPVSLRCCTSWGFIEAEVSADSGLLDVLDVVPEVFTFQVTGDVAAIVGAPAAQSGATSVTAAIP